MENIVRLENIGNKEDMDNIRDLTDCIVHQVDPLKVILFGSFADGSYTDESDYDFYIIIDDEESIPKTSFLVNKAIREKMKRPVDIVIGKKTRFEQKRRISNSMMIESEVLQKGILLYDRIN